MFKQDIHPRDLGFPLLGYDLRSELKVLPALRFTDGLAGIRLLGYDLRYEIIVLAALRFTDGLAGIYSHENLDKLRYSLDCLSFSIRFNKRFKFGGS